MPKVVVMDGSEPEWSRLRDLVMAQVEETRSEDQPSHAIWLNLAKDLMQAADVPAPTIQDWMMAKMAAKYRVQEFWTDPAPDSRSAAERWAAGDIPGQDPDK